ncbi:MAG TPA: serine/threonine-protein kinase [Blastocatellia bacterium]|nr:serine/threonine-protein kinase [Blastocatellia bacterium]
MEQKRWKKIEELFEAALERRPDERARFLTEACGDDTSLRQEVESLLAHQQPTGRFIPTLIHEAAKLLPDDSSRFDRVDRADREARFIPGLVLAGRYRIIGLLGKGGMGEVYRADDLKLGQPVALKFLPESLARDKAMLERFHKEVRIARQISHPHICRVYDIGEVEGQHFLSMEYVDGEDLGSLLRRIGRLPSDKAVEIASQLCAGLAASHDQGVLHRDLKPANVMIDGRGKARIMDFGLAGLAGDFRGNEVRAGTPAYMAPEQLAGKEVSVKSDIYSLGLLLYEIFTGKKLFEATSLEDLMRQHESSTPPSISEHVKEVDPLVERVISRCLETDPRNRPASVAQVAAALPGGDPLAAAIAAGETPSPEMVAAAPKEGALRPGVAIACLALCLAMLAFLVIFSDNTKMLNKAKLSKSPDVLAERAAQIITRLGYTSPPIDTAYGFALDPSYMHRLDEFFLRGRSTIDKGQPLTYYFWYRQSPRYLETLAFNRVSLSDPPLEVTDMANVVLDPRGRLVRFSAVPPQVEEGESEPGAPDWSALFVEAGLDQSAFRPVASKWVPPAAADARAAWEGVYPDSPEIPIRVEAASFKGKIVYFHIIPPWEPPLRQQEVFSRTAPRAAGVILAVVFISGLIAALLVARRNLRLGRGDKKSAYKLAIFVFVTDLVGTLFMVNHVPTIAGELNLWLQASALALFAAVLFWFLYVALEPYVRRRWPTLIISWSRLMAGEFRDPLVGRDILVGAILGFAHTMTIYSITLLLSVLVSPNLANDNGDANIYGTRALVSQVFNSIIGSILFGLGLLFLLLLFFIILRKKRLAILALGTIHAAISYLAFVANLPWYVWYSALVIPLIYLVSVSRFGLLTTISLQFFFGMSFFLPLTPDLSSVYGGTTIFVVSMLSGLALYSFYISLAGQPIVRTELLND